MSAVATFAAGTELRARIHLDLAAHLDRHAAVVELTRSLGRVGIHPDSVVASDDGVAFDLVVGPGLLPELAASLRTWRAGPTPMPVSAPAPHTLPDLADAVAFPLPVPTPADIVTAPAHVILVTGRAGSAGAADEAHDVLRAALLPARPLSPGARDVPEPPRGRRWVQLPADAPTALVRRHRLLRAAPSAEREVARGVVIGALGGWADSLLAAGIRRLGLSYSPAARSTARGGGELIILDVVVAPDAVSVADAAVTDILMDAAGGMDAEGALARAKGRAIVQNDSSRGRLDTAHRTLARARRWPGAGAADELEILRRLSAQTVADEARHLLRPAAFDTLVLSPRERPDPWETL